MKNRLKKIFTRKFWLASKLRTASIFLVLVLLSSAVIFVLQNRQASAAVTVDTSTSSSATAESRNTFWDSSTALYWSFYYNGSAIEYSNSSNGSSWTSQGNLAINTNSFSVWNDDAGLVYIAYSNSGLKDQTGTLGPSSITWSGDNGLQDPGIISNLSIAQSSNGYIWICYQVTTGAPSFTTTIKTIRTSSANDLSTWQAATTRDSGASASSTAVSAPQIVPLSTAGDMLAVWYKSDSGAGTTKLRWSKYTFSGNSWATAADLVSASSTLTDYSLTGYPDTNGGHIIYRDSGVKYQQYTAGSPGSWSSATVVDAGTDTSLSLTLDSTNSTLYAFWITSNAIKYSIAVSPYTTWSSPLTGFNTGTNANLSSSYKAGNSKIMAQWTNGSGSPWNVDWDFFAAQVPPNAPTSSFTSGQTVSSSTPAFTFNGTDTNSIDDLRYDFQLDTANSFDTTSAASASGISAAGTGLSSAGPTSSGESFAGDGRYIQSAIFPLSKTGSPTGNATAKIYAHTGSYGSTGVPTGSALATSDTFDVSTIPAGGTPTNETFTFSGSNRIRLDSGTNYFIVVDYSGGNSSNKVSPWQGTGLASGNSASLTSGVWTSSSSDILFEVDSGPLDKVSGTDTGFSGSPDNTDPFTNAQDVTYTVQSGDILTRGNTYYWRVRAKDPSGTNTYGSWSSTFQFTVNSIPATPTLINPSSGQTKVSVQPQFELRTTDADSDYIQYFIQLYDATACGGSQVGSDIDGTSSQTNWQNLNANSNTAYLSAAAIASSTMARYQYASTVLTPNHVYSWRAKAKDPGGSTVFSSLSSCQDFTTATSETSVQGGTTIRGGTRLQ
jgi:hypothetical protein